MQTKQQYTIRYIYCNVVRIARMRRGTARHSEAYSVVTVTSQRP